MRILGFSRGAGCAKAGPILAVAATLLFSVHVQGKQKQDQPESLLIPQRVCRFITGRMNSVTPQARTRCYTKQGNSPSTLYVYIYSPENVLEGQMRRAWSSALFQILEDMGKDNSLNGACTEDPQCYFSISDAYTEGRHWHYETTALRDTGSAIQGFSGPVYIDQASESWYLAGWKRLIASKRSDTPGSQNNALRLAESACERYLSALMKNHTETPSCSVMSATSQAIYIALDFGNIMTPTLPEYTFELPSTVGKTLDNSGYDGQVVLRTPWVATVQGATRVYRTIPLQGIEFAYEEEQSGLRDELDAWRMLKSSFFESGQIARDRLYYDDTENSLHRTAAVLRYLAGPSDTVILDTTDGAEWMVSRDDFERCKLSAGSEIQITTESISGNAVSRDGPPTITRQEKGVPCAAPASFLKGW
jgi:hypothetical protein